MRSFTSQAPHWMWVHCGQYTRRIEIFESKKKRLFFPFCVSRDIKICLLCGNTKHTKKYETHFTNTPHAHTDAHSDIDRQSHSHTDTHTECEMEQEVKATRCRKKEDKYCGLRWLTLVCFFLIISSFSLASVRLNCYRSVVSTECDWLFIAYEPTTWNGKNKSKWIRKIVFKWSTHHTFGRKNSLVSIVCSLFNIHNWRALYSSRVFFNSPHFYGRSTDRHTRKQWIKCQNPNATVNWTHIHKHRLHARSAYMCVCLCTENRKVRRAPTNTNTTTWHTQSKPRTVCEWGKEIKIYVTAPYIRCALWFLVVVRQIFNGIQAFSDLLWIVKSDDSILFFFLLVPFIWGNFYDLLLDT